MDLPASSSAIPASCVGSSQSVLVPVRHHQQKEMPPCGNGRSHTPSRFAGLVFAGLRWGEKPTLLGPSVRAGWRGVAHERMSYPPTKFAGARERQPKTDSECEWDSSL